MATLNVKLLVNRFDCDPTAKGAEFCESDTVATVKERFFAGDIEQKFNIRIIHGGCSLQDDVVLSGIRGYEAGELLVLTVFVTKRDTTPPVVEEDNRRNLWKLSTPVWIAVLATLWFPLFVIYVITFVFLHVMLTRLMRSGRIDSQ